MLSCCVASAPQTACMHAQRHFGRLLAWHYPLCMLCMCFDVGVCCCCCLEEGDQLLVLCLRAFVASWLHCCCSRMPFGHSHRPMTHVSLAACCLLLHQILRRRATRPTATAKTQKIKYDPLQVNVPSAIIVLCSRLHHHHRDIRERRRQDRATRRAAKRNRGAARQSGGAARNIASRGR